ncbi:MAG: hypothetical protein ACRCXX_11670 [Cetobacterium sp.]|uniref:hypothetical protein n=1 Tax=Cetobacterium sp. TaxID=2071632 RepID=UPI003F35575C
MVKYLLLTRVCALIAYTFVLWNTRKIKKPLKIKCDVFVMSLLFLEWLFVVSYWEKIEKHFKRAFHWVDNKLVKVVDFLSNILLKGVEFIGFKEDNGDTRN